MPTITANRLELWTSFGDTYLTAYGPLNGTTHIVLTGEAIGQAKALGSAGPMTQDEMNRLCADLLPLWREAAVGVVKIARRIAELPGATAAYCAAYIQQVLCEDGDTEASVLFTDELARLSAAKTANAAGELLAALEMIVNAYPSAVTWHDAAFLDTARAAIAKARGQS